MGLESTSFCCCKVFSISEIRKSSLCVPKYAEFVPFSEQLKSSQAERTAEARAICEALTKPKAQL